MIVRLAVVLLAIIAAFVPLPASFVEQWYSRGLYPQLQRVVTPVSNVVPIALFDIAIGCLLAAGMFRIMRITGWRQRLRWTGLALLTTAAVVYLTFLMMWGLNYRRVRLEEKLAFDSSRINRAALMALADTSVVHINQLHLSAHAIALDPRTVERSLLDAQQAVGGTRPFVAGVPKRSLLSLYFRQTAIDGMTNPLFLEIILNEDLLPFERPMVLAHEWAHLAGYAHEAEANFIAWLACLRGDALMRYSAWLSTYGHAMAGLTREEGRNVKRLEAGPREDLNAMAKRYARSRPIVRRAARDMYDSYLKANRVDEGIASYHAVVRLMLGTEFSSEGAPRLRRH